jgi:signal transduction histidine kinase
MAPEPPIFNRPDPAALADLMRTFNETGERMRRSHDALLKRVAELTGELEEKNRELARRNRLAVIGEMAACLAHEIRNPLGGVQMYASMLEEELPAGSEPRRTVEKLLAGLRGLNDLVEEMLTFTRDMRPELCACDLADIMDSAVEGAAHALAGREVRRDCARPVPVHADPAMLARVFTNLLVNAAQAAPEKGGVLRLSASFRDGRARASVADNGPGIPAEALPRLFTPFFTNRTRGTGLGLAIALRIVEAHGGTIRGGNGPSGGAEFTVELPEAP